jgi:hypothetical protein
LPGAHAKQPMAPVCAW